MPFDAPNCSRVILRLLVAGLLALALLSSACGAGNGTKPSPSSAELWRSDLDFLTAQMADRHPDLYVSVANDEFERTVQELRERIPDLSDNEIVAEIMRLVASVGDAHTQVDLWEQTGFRIYPLRLFEFSDGLFVVDAQEPYADSIGTRVARVGDTHVGDVYDALRPLAVRDNPVTVMGVVPTLILVPELLQAIGVVTDAGKAEWVFESPGGETFALNLEPIQHTEYEAWYTSVSESLTALPQNREVLYLSDTGERFWLADLEAESTLYIQYNEVQGTSQSGETVDEFARRVGEIASERDVRRVVVDLRHNHGGNGFTFGPFLRVLSEHPEINRPGRLFTILGRQTFSAAIMFVAAMERFTDTLFVGEPTGGRPNHFGDPEPLVLPNSGLRVFVSSLRWQCSSSDDDRLSFQPDIAVDVSSSDYFENHDPVLDAVLAYAGEPISRVTPAGETDQESNCPTF